MHGTPPYCAARGRWTWFLFAALVLLFALTFQGSRSLWEPDEGRYAESAREMLVTGDWLTPHLDFRPHLTKPPLTYWMAATGMLVFGKSEWGVRFFHALAFAAAALVVGLLGEAMGSRREGLLAGLIFLSSVLTFSAGNLLTPDLPLSLFEIIAVYGFWLSYARQPARSKLAILLTWGGFGAAVLCKGPVGLLPLVAIALFLAMRRRGIIWRCFLSIEGGLLFMLLGFGWFLFQVARQPDLANYFLGYELLGRLFTTIHYRTFPWYAYELILLAGMLPWTLFVPGLLRQAWRRGAERHISQAVRGSPRRLFLALWVVAPLLILTLAHSRSYLYVVPLVAPLSLALAIALARSRTWWSSTEAVWPRRGVCLALALWLLLLLGVKRGAADIVLPGRDVRALAERLEPYLAVPKAKVLLLGMNGRHGLAFYLQRNLEYVEIAQALTLRHTEKTLPEELAELPTTPRRRLFIGRWKHRDALDRLLPSNYRVRFRVHGYLIYVYDPPAQPAS